MSGVFGIADPGRQTDIRALIGKMTAAMSHRDWFVADHFADHEHNLAIGRIGIGIFNKASQPTWNSTHTVALAMAGELYNKDALGRNVIEESDEQLALALYEKLGDDFVTQLNGAFTLAIWDKTRNLILIANDHFGLYPLYYAHYHGKLVFAPEMKGILCDPDFRKELNLTALAEYVRFQRLLGQKTFFEGLELLPSASLLRYEIQTDYLTIQPYWDFSKIPSLNVTFEEAVEEAGRLLRQATSCLASGPYRVGVYLSGGKDSRTLLGLATRERTPIHSVTFGARGCRDVVYAQRIANRVGSKHHFFEYKDGRWVQENIDFHLELTEGLHNWLHLHGIDTLEPMREHIDLQLTGFCGDHLLHSRLRERFPYRDVKTWDTLAFTAEMFYLLSQKFSWPGLNEGEAEYVYAGPMREKMRGRAFASLEQELAPFEKYESIKCLEYFQFINHCMRLTHNYVIFFRSSMEVRYPFLDYAFFDFVCGLPPEIRFDDNGRLYRELLNKEVPELTLIPLDKDERLLTNHRFLWAVHALAQRFKQAINHYIAPVFPQRATLYADYESYLRTDLRDWGESILFDKRTLERGIFNPQFLRSIWARHQSGKELQTIGKIAPIMTYEMMLRRFYD
jgi:asparagine synthase (glutamine-hydrolysing)